MVDRSTAEALEYVRSQGIVLMSARGPVPRLVDAVAGEVVAGSWWGHPKGRLIFQVTSAVLDSTDVLSCPLIGGKVTLVHRRLWPALVRLRSVIGEEKLSRLRSEHTASGAHRRVAQPLGEWLPPDVAEQASRLSAEEARLRLESWSFLTQPAPERSAARRQTKKKS